MDWTALQTNLTQEYFGNPLQNYLIASAVFLAVFTTLPILRALIMRHLTRLSEKTANDIDDLLVDLLRRLIGPFVYLWAALYFGMLALTLPARATQLLQSLFIAVQSMCPQGLPIPIQ